MAQPLISLINETIKHITNVKAEEKEPDILRGEKKTQFHLGRKYLQGGGFLPQDESYRFCIFCKHPFVDEPAENKNVFENNRQKERQLEDLKSQFEDYKNGKKTTPPTGLNGKPITSAKQLATMKPPAAQDYWNNKIPDLWWNLVWGGKTLYATPRDKIAQLQLKHRNLWVAKHGGCDNTTCNAHGCTQEESQLHLWECQIIQRDFWRIIKQDMRHLGFVPEDEITYWILGVTKKDEHTGRPMRSLPNEEAGIVYIAWRALYAEIVKRRLEGGALNLKEARYKTWRMVLARVKAYGARWRKWYRRQQGHTHPKTFPQAHQQHALIELDDHANFEINDKLPALVKRCRE